MTENIGIQQADNPQKARGRGRAIGRALFFFLPAFILFFGIAGFIALGLLKPDPKKDLQTTKAVPVLATVPIAKPTRLEVLTQGEVQARTEIDIVPQVGGKIEYISKGFLEGGTFVRDEILIQIEKADYELRVVQAEATVAQARQALVREQAEAAIARKDWDELGVGEASALTLRKPQLAQAEAALAAAKASLADANLQLMRTAIRAPFAGRVRTKNADVGQFVTPGARLGRIFSTSVVDVRLPLTDAELAKLSLPLAFAETEGNLGPEVELSAKVLGEDRIWRGRITRTDSAIDPATRVLFAFVEVQDPYGAGSDEGMPLLVGLFVQAKVHGKALPSALVIPRSALRGNNQVYLAKGDELSIVEVEVASSDRDVAIITNGLHEDDEVITSPVLGARDGLKIERVTRSVAKQTAKEE